MKTRSGWSLPASPSEMKCTYLVSDSNALSDIYSSSSVKIRIFLRKHIDPIATGGKETLHDVWKYNASLNKWIQIEYLNTGRWRHKMAVLGGKVYVLGGFDGIQRLSSVEAYDPFHNCWTEVSDDDCFLLQ